MDRQIAVEIFAAIESDDAPALRELLVKHPEFVHYDDHGSNWMHHAARNNSPTVVGVLAELGCDPNAEMPNSSRDTPLFCALVMDDTATVEALLKHGADPRKGRVVITAITGSNQDSLRQVQLLERYGADLHRVFPFADGSNINAISMAINYQKEDVVEYLRSKGCVMPDQLVKAEQDEPVDAELLPDEHDEVMAYFTEHFGPVQAEALIEIVPTEPPIVVHVIPATTERTHITLFTTGMSDQPMTVPAGQEEFRFAELYIQLPGDWKYRDIENPEHGWPIHWLRSMAQHPHRTGSWLGGAVTLVANDEPPEPLAPNTKFTTLMLMADRQALTGEGRTIQLYRMTPLYTEEWQLEIDEGLPALMQAFDRHGTPFIVDLDRPNVAAGLK